MKKYDITKLSKLNIGDRFYFKYDFKKTVWELENFDIVYSKIPEFVISNGKKELTIKKDKAVIYLRNIHDEKH